ncbi:TIGR02466 family protein [Corallincola holothuriorum]|nr:TIGR02466 family protein [Corallincola holothuriorum]
MQSNINIGMHFAVPIVRVSYPSPEALNRDLRDMFLAWEKDGVYKTLQPVPTNQVNIYESEWALLDREEPQIRSLRKFIMHSLLHSVAKLNNLDQTASLKLKPNIHSWVHLTSNGGYVSQHNHPNASWSGIYFVDPGESLAESKDSGLVKFATPNPAIKMHRDAGNCSLQGPLSHNTLVIQPKAGDLVIFPSYLMHEVSPYVGSGRRITIAFNCWFT